MTVVDRASPVPRIEQVDPAALADAEQAGRAAEQRMLMRKFWVSAAVSVPVVLLSYPWLFPVLLGAFVYNTAGVPIAAGVLYPFTGLLLSPLLAAAAMAFSSVTVVSNANRLRRFTPKEH